MAKEFTYDQAYGLVKEMATVLADPTLQSQLAAAWEAAGDDKAKAKARSEILQPVQQKVIAKYGYEASPKGMVESTMDYRVYNHIQEIHELNMQVGYWINPGNRSEYPTLEDWMKVQPAHPPPEKDAKEKPFNVEDAIRMTEELIVGYSSESFQAEIKRMAEEAGGDQKKFQKGVGPLCLEKVQSKVLPKYGFDGTQRGVIASMSKFGPWNNTEPTIYRNNAITGYYTSLAAVTVPFDEYMAGIDAGIEQAKAAMAAAAAAPAPKEIPKEFNLEAAKMMLDELIAGYSSDEFQSALKKIVDESGGDERKMQQARGPLCLDMVQSKVLPKYGFEGNRKGVVQSMNAFQPFNNDPECFEKNSTVTYWITPSMHTQTVDEYLAELKKQVEAAIAAAAQAAPAAPAAPAQAAPATPAAQPKPSTKPKKELPRVSAQVLKEKMRKAGKSTSGIQRIDAQGQNAGWAPSEFIDEVVYIYEHGSYLTENGSFDEAEPYLREALMYFEEIVGEGHSYTLLCANQLCYTLHQLGRFSEGEPLGRSAVEGFKRNFGTNHEHTVAAMNNYALCCQGNENMAGAIDILKQALKVSEGIHGARHHATCAIKSNLAETMRLDGDLAGAESLFTEAFMNEARASGGESLGCAMYANNLAVVSRDQDKNGMAAYWYSRAIRGLTAFYGKDHEKVKLVEKNFKELTGDPDPRPFECPKFLLSQPRKAENQCFLNHEGFASRPMCSFSGQATKGFAKRIDLISAAFARHEAEMAA